MARQPTPDEIQWMKENADDTLVPNVIACCITCGVLSAGVVTIRVWSRYIIHRQLVPYASDQLLLISWIFNILFLVSFGSTTRYGEGRHIILVTDPRLLQIWTIITEVAYYLGMGFAKFSILRLFAEIFVVQTFHRIIWGVTGFVAAWLTSSALVSIFQCTPIRYAWDANVSGGYCINYGLLVLVAGVFNIVTDVTLLLLPIPLVWKLNISRQKKYLITFTFGMGSSACVISVVRLAYSLKVGSTSDGSWDNVAPGFVTAAELLVAILAASIPTYRPLWHRLTSGSTASKGHSSDRDVVYMGRGSSMNRANVSVGHSAVPENDQRIHITDQVEMLRYTSRNGVWVKMEDPDDRSY